MSCEEVGGQYPVKPPLEAPPPIHVQPPPVQQPPQAVKPPPYAYPGQTQPPMDQPSHYPASPGLMYAPPAPPGPMYGQPAPPGPMYAQQQQSNVVMVTSQPAQPPAVVTQQVNAPDYLTLTKIGFIVCLMSGGLFGMALLIPALICSLTAQKANASGDYMKARTLGRASLGWNIATYIITILVDIAVLITVVVVPTQIVGSTSFQHLLKAVLLPVYVQVLS